jgi:hypothetical protein
MKRNEENNMNFIFQSALGVKALFFSFPKPTAEAFMGTSLVTAAN